MTAGVVNDGDRGKHRQPQCTFNLLDASDGRIERVDEKGESHGEQNAQDQRCRNVNHLDGPRRRRRDDGLVQDRQLTRRFRLGQSRLLVRFVQELVRLFGGFQLERQLIQPRLAPGQVLSRRGLFLNGRGQRAAAGVCGALQWTRASDKHR